MNNTVVVLFRLDNNNIGIARGVLVKITNQTNIELIDVTVNYTINGKEVKDFYPKVLIRGSNVIAVFYMNNHG